MLWIKQIWRRCRKVLGGGKFDVRKSASDIPADEFDAHWYLQAYPDVAAAGVDPWVHYVKHGRFEGRLPRRNCVMAWEQRLWSGSGELMLPRLQALTQASDAGVQERFYACWALARWYAWKHCWPQAAACLQRFRHAPEPYPVHAGPYLLLAEAALRCGFIEEAQAVLEELALRFPDSADVLLVRANIAARVQHGSGQLAAVNQIFKQHSLGTVAVADGSNLHLDALEPQDQRSVIGDADSPLVSVVVPAYNAERTVATALRSLCQQSWRNLEILVVDDASTDGTWNVLEDFVRESRLRPGLNIRLLRHESNQGAYAARNTALAQASGEFITTHDSDDWSHPQKIEHQVRALLQQPGKAASVSHWVRTTPEMVFGRWRAEESWIHRNVSSLMVRRAVVEKMGYWDRVAVNADTEYYYRLLTVFGDDSIVEVLPGVPLSFGRMDNGSLSQTGATHLLTRFNGVRKDYEDAARRWHASVADKSELYLPAKPQLRPFLAPTSLCRESTPVTQVHPKDLVQQSGWFDSAWYVQQYADLQESTEDPFEHYWHIGASAGRDPGPGFSTSGYLARYPDAAYAGQPALYHYLTVGQAKGYEPLPEFSGRQPFRKHAPTIMVCAHQAGPQLYGAERSLLDLVAAFDTLGINLVVTLPSAANPSYIDAIRDRARAVVVLPYRWWHAQRSPSEATQTEFERLLKHYGAQILYANTLVLDEPLLAARALRIPTVVHVRELPEQDQALCQTLGDSAGAIVRRVGKMADVVVANSMFVGEAMGVPDAVVVPNIIDATQFGKPLSSICEDKRPINIALVSSNLPKKGLNDFVTLAELLDRHDVPVRCVLVGPENEHTGILRARQEKGEIPRNLHIAGYAPGPKEALATADVVLNLSHFQESFGRTVLEAMAAGLPVVAYRWGALTELILDGETGYLVPLGDVAAVANRVMMLVRDTDLRARLGRAGRERAVQCYSECVMLHRLETVLEKVGLGLCTD